MLGFAPIGATALGEGNPAAQTFPVWAPVSLGDVKLRLSQPELSKLRVTEPSLED